MPVELEMVLRILLAIVLGSVIGFQRGKAEKPAGLRATEWNLLLNPRHDQFPDIELGRIGPHAFDARVKGNPAQ